MTQPTLFPILVALHSRLARHNVLGVYQGDTLKYSDGPVQFELGDVATIIEAFVELGATQDQIADALASMALDSFGIEHGYGGHGLTIGQWRMRA